MRTETTPVMVTVSAVKDISPFCVEVSARKVRLDNLLRLFIGHGKGYSPMSPPDHPKYVFSGPVDEPVIEHIAREIEKSYALKSSLASRVLAQLGKKLDDQALSNLDFAQITELIGALLDRHDNSDSGLSAAFGNLLLDGKNSRTFSLDDGDRGITMPGTEAGGFEVVDSSTRNSIARFYSLQDGTEIAFYRGDQYTGQSSILGGGDSTVVPMRKTGVRIKPEPFFDIIGKIDLAQLSKNLSTIQGRRSIVDHFNIHIDPDDRSGASDAIFEHLNSIAETTRLPATHTGPLFLLTENQVRRIANHVDTETVKKYGFEDSVSILSRRNGRVVLPGSPLFDESTLKDSSTWYVAKIRQ